jgi:hypothetical protein
MDWTFAVRRPDGTPTAALKPGEYARNDHGDWALCDPHGTTFEPGKFHSTVTENQDGTIFCIPPIGSVVTPLEDGTAFIQPPIDPDVWYGWLEAGFWKPIPHKTFPKQHA